MSFRQAPQRKRPGSLRASCMYGVFGSAGKLQAAVGTPSKRHQHGGGHDDDAGRHFKIGLGHIGLLGFEAILSGMRKRKPGVNRLQPVVCV